MDLTSFKNSMPLFKCVCHIGHYVATFERKLNFIKCVSVNRLLRRL